LSKFASLGLSKLINPYLTVKKNYFLSILFVIISIFLGYAQISIIDFETNLSGYSHTPSQTPATDPGDQYFHRAQPIDGAIYESGGPYTNVTGNWLFVGSNPNTINGSNPGILTFDPINISGFSNLELSMDWGGVPNDWDASDEISVEYRYDNAGSWTVLSSFRNPVPNDPFELSGNATGGANTANGLVLTYGLQTITTDNFSGAGSLLNIRVVVNANANYEAFGLDNVVLNGTASVPSISANPTSINGLDYELGSGPSAEESINVVGTNLTNTISVSAPSNFEVSNTSGSGFGSNITLPATGGTLYVRLAAGLAVSTYTGNISLSSTGATTVNVSVNGEVSVASSCSSIFQDDFSSGLGAWSNTADWTTSGGELKHDLLSIEAQSHIYADITNQNLNAGDYEWNFCMRNGTWDPSSGNDFTFYLLSDDTNLQINASGYAVGVNRTGISDLLTLYEVTNGSHSAIITSAFNWGNADDVCVKVTRNSSGSWELFYDPNGTGEISAGTVTDNTHSLGSYIGAFFDFTSSRAGQLWIDDVSVCSNVVVSGPELQLIAASNNVSCGYTMDFGNVESNGTTLDLSVFVQNDGSTTLDINSLNISGTNAIDFSIVSPTSSFPVSIVPGGSEEIIIRFTSNTNGIRTAQLTIGNTDSADANDESSCVVNLTGTGITNTGSGALMITQYYEGSGLNKWIEIANVSGAPVAANSYYLATYNQGSSCVQRPLNGDPNASVALPAMATDEVIRLKEPATTVPGYAVPGQPGYDGNPTYNMFIASFSGDDIIVISTTNDASCYSNRIDVIGEYSQPCPGSDWGNRKCLIRKECVASTPSITFDIDDWIVFEDSEVENPTLGTNPYLGQHFRGTTEYTGNGAFNGWTNGLPERSRIVEISQNYLTSSTSIGSFESCSLIVNSPFTLDIENGDYISVEEDLTTNAGSTLEIRNQGQLVMIEDLGVVTNNGTTNVRKTTASMAQYDYVYWSSPVDYSTVTPFPTPIFLVLTEFNPTHMYRFDTVSFNDLNNDVFDDEQDDWDFYDGDMKPGNGYATMTANNSPSINNAVYSGLINNGIVQVDIFLSGDENGDSDGDEDDWNLVGNPYPSAISADALVTQNPDINGTLYFWTHNEPISIENGGPDAMNFSANDYAMYNVIGGVGTAAGTGGSAPTGFIASGQGFFVDAINTGTLTFNNSMRSINYANNDFFRNTDNQAVEEKDRFWLNLTNPDGAYSEILIGFIEDATNQKDRLYDGVRLLGSNYFDFYSSDESDLKYGIQGRTGFSDLDIIPVGYKSNITGNLTISLKETEGALSQQNIYLLDKQLNIIHDLSIPYAFYTEIGDFHERFEIIFNLDTLNNQAFNVTNNDLQIIDLNHSDVKFKINSSHLLETITIIDLQGRIVYKFEDLNNSELILNLSNLSQSTYIISVVLDNGIVLHKKAIKR
jgi:hypothetical protein